MSQETPAPVAGPQNTEADGSGAPSADRTITPVPGRLGAAKGKAIMLAALVVGSATLLGLTWDRESVEEVAPRDPARQVVDFETTGGQAQRPTLAEPGPKPPLLGDDTALVVPAIEPRGAQPTANDGHRAVRRPEPAAPLLVYSRQAAMRAAPAPAPAPAPNHSVVDKVSSTEIDKLRQGSNLGVLQADRLPDRNFLILAGSNLPCVLMTALDSTIPGHVSCLTPRDVFSDNGTTILLDKGTRVLGEHRSGMRQGQRRIFVFWTRAITPDGVVVSLSSPAADALGRAGFDGDVDNRFWARFGGALALSLVDDGAYAAFGSTGQSARIPSDAAAVAMEGSLDIAPVLRKNQGDEVSIFVAHDLDFSGVYGLRAH
ncbi:MAG: TrbI/VirB10 family protein [Pseudomonadota bacterium]